MRRRISLGILCFLLVLPLVSAHYPMGDNHTRIAFRPFEPPIAEMSTILDIMVLNESSQPVLSLDTVHDRKMHVFIISEDFATFQHIHPEDYQYGFLMSWGGMYSVETQFPNAGKYLIVADYTTSGQTRTATYNVTIDGNTPMSAQPRDFSRSKRSGDVTITFRPPRAVYADEPVQLSYELLRGSERVRDLGMLLGSEVHIVGLNTNLTKAFHTHAYRAGHSLHLGSMPQQYTGPTVPVEVVFAEPGDYAVFSQFNVSNEVQTVYFMLTVQPAREEGAAEESRTQGWLLYGVIAASAGAVLTFIWWNSQKERKSKQN